MDRKTQIKEKYDLSLTAHTQQVSHRSKVHSAIPNLTWDCPSLICKLKSRPNVSWYRSRPQSLVIHLGIRSFTHEKNIITYHHRAGYWKMYLQYWILNIECKCFVVKVWWTGPGVRSRNISVAFRTQQPASRLLQLINYSIYLILTHCCNSSKTYITHS